MNKWIKRIPVIALIFTFAFKAFPTTVQAAPDGRELWDRIVAGGDFTLASDEVLEGSLVVFGGNVTLEENSKVDGDVVVFGGNLNAAGEVMGDFLSFGGNIDFSRTATIYGSLTQFGGNVEQEPGVTIKGEIFSGQNFNFIWDESGHPFNGTFLPTMHNFGLNYPFMFSILWLLFVSLLMAALAIVVMLLFPTPTERIAHTAISQVIVSWGLGFLTALVLPFLLILLVITIVLIPITMVGFLGMAIAFFFGWIAVGYEIGNRFNLQMHLHWSPPVSAGLGTFVLTLINFGIVKLIPCIGWILPFMVLLPLGLGAVLLTRFGTQVYPLGDVVSNGESASAAFALPPTTPVAQTIEGSISTENEPPKEDAQSQSENDDHPR